MPTIIILAIVATIAITGLLTAMLYRMNAPKGIRRRDASGDGYAGGGNGRDRRDSDNDSAGDGSSDGGGGGDGGGD